MAKTKPVSVKRTTTQPAAKNNKTAKKVSVEKPRTASKTKSTQKKTVKKQNLRNPSPSDRAGSSHKNHLSATPQPVKENATFKKTPSIIASRKSIKHIAVAGNIGSGKTTLTQQLSKHYGWLPHFEDVENNPYLNDFYEDMPRWSFNLQIYFLNKRFKQIIEIQSGEEVVIQDRTIHEDAFIFAPNLHSMGLMSSRDFENYRSLYETISSLIRPPDLLIYLRASVPTLVNQIQKRGREYEDNLRLDYLRRLNDYYEKWVTSYTDGKLLIIDVDKLNFADDKDALGEVIRRIDAELFGLF
jgi:deoxyadenosine/deoxycytidine kinase